MTAEKLSPASKKSQTNKEEWGEERKLTVSHFSHAKLQNSEGFASFSEISLNSKALFLGPTLG